MQINCTRGDDLGKLFLSLSFDFRLVSENSNATVSYELRRQTFRFHGGKNRVLLIVLFISFSEIFQRKDAQIR